MKVRTFRIHGFRVREWECCGLLWQLYLSKNFPERENWKPICPKCKKE